ncbi:hypothetical protein T265_12337 [Opisthorchis viverrini]|uniref:Uncharacterized protein n=1 Tax=Opisthorchis viverrini TaxID=6198 RepID=A0A074YU28_OPIVI|nr:hypothetical protein T265_12337 [Opisthorchis viverrini]KER18218.1 hypothetical protein T265_12337 [Opisthorchis viverrini]
MPVATFSTNRDDYPSTHMDEILGQLHESTEFNFAVRRASVHHRIAASSSDATEQHTTRLYWPVRL